MPGIDDNQARGIATGKPDDRDTTQTFIDGSTRSHASLRSVAIGFGTYRPGWRWSLHVGAATGKESESHIGYMISGRMIVKDASGKEVEVGPGDAFEVGHGHDAWVVGEIPCVALDFATIPYNRGR